MFTQFKLYIIGAVVGLIAILSAWVKYQSGKIDKLEEENESLESTSKATAEQAEYKEEVILNEQVKIVEGVKKSENKTKLDRLNDF